MWCGVVSRCVVLCSVWCSVVSCGNFINWPQVKSLYIDAINRHEAHHAAYTVHEVCSVVSCCVVSCRVVLC